MSDIMAVVNHDRSGDSGGKLEKAWIGSIIAGSKVVGVRIKNCSNYRTRSRA